MVSVALDGTVTRLFRHYPEPYLYYSIKQNRADEVYACLERQGWVLSYLLQLCLGFLHLSLCRF
jgi:hypothetical protein